MKGLVGTALVLGVMIFWTWQLKSKEQVFQKDEILLFTKSLQPLWQHVKPGSRITCSLQKSEGLDKYNWIRLAYAPSFMMSTINTSWDTVLFIRKIDDSTNINSNLKLLYSFKDEAYQYYLTTKP